MRLPAPFYAWDEHIAIDLPGARTLFTTRRGGFSEGPYTSLNMGRMTDDRFDAVARNRARVQELAGVPTAMIFQVHGTSVRTVSGMDELGVAMAPDEDVDLPRADGQATRLHGVAPMVLTADCLPIAVAGDGAVGMLHAGWRGLAGGIVAAGVRAVRDLGADGSLEAAIGPGAGGCCYEVGDEVFELFAEHGNRVRHGRNIDLKAIARDQLERAGVEVVHDVDLCTICADESLFFSHRRDHGVTGRQAGLVWLS
ncbi:MAG TPA: polyphenol oxidase family protein [Solirubrobacteraceae bacterium]|nr:polyphenol oxidase family protein [Solirubrobacteraceae bacterium]